MRCVLRKREKEALKERKEERNRISVKQTSVNEETKENAVISIREYKRKRRRIYFHNLETCIKFRDRERVCYFKANS